VLAEKSQPPPKPVFTSISFSNNGNYILIGTSSDTHYVLDAFSLTILRRLSGHRGLSEGPLQPRHGSSGEEVSWSSDSRWVASGSADGGVFFWDIAPPPGQDKIEPPNVLDRLSHPQPVVTLQPAVSLATGRAASRTVKLNPRFLVMAVGGEELVSPRNVYSCLRLTDFQSFWLPAKDDDVKMHEGW